MAVKKPNPNSLKNLEKGRNTRFKAGDAQARVIQSMGGKASQRKRSAQAVFQQILASVPQLDKNTINTLAKLGIKSSDDVDIQTIIGAAIAQKGMRGDTKAAQLAFDMAGELMATKLAQEKVKLERERLELEKQRLELERQSAAQNEVLIGGVDPFIEALAAYGASMTKMDTDVPEGAAMIDNNSGEEHEPDETAE